MNGEILMGYDLLLIDGNGLAHRSAAVLQLTNSQGENTNVIFGVMRMIRAMIERFEVKDICVCWDWKGSVLKKAAYSDYKKNRRGTLPPDYYSDLDSQIDKLYTVLPAFGIKQLRQEGVEADDVIGLLCEGLLAQGKKILVLSSDQDLFQLVAYGADVYYTHKDFIFTKENFKENVSEQGLKLEMEPENYIFYKALKGDDGDNIDGLAGFGKVTAKKFINKYGPWTEWYQQPTGASRYFLKPGISIDGLTAKQKASIQAEDALAKLLRNYSLMSVGWLDRNIADELLEEFYSQAPAFEEEKIKEYFLAQQFDGTLARWRTWSHPFRILFRRKFGWREKDDERA